jgi:carboxymethylenebutenolidase
MTDFAAAFPLSSVEAGKVVFNRDAGKKDAMRAWALIVLLLQIGAGAAFAADKELTVPTTDGPVRATVMTAQGDAPRPSVLLLHGRDGIKPEDAYRRYAAALTVAGINAWLFSYYSPSDEQIMLNPGREAHIGRYRERFRAWAEKTAEIAEFALAQPGSSGRIGLLGLSNGGFLAVGAAAIEPRVNAIAVCYGGIPGPMRTDVTRLPPLIVLHGEADQVIPVDEGRALADKAKALGGKVQLVVYPDAGHGFDFDPVSDTARDARVRAVEFLSEWLLSRD